VVAIRAIKKILHGANALLNKQRIVIIHNHIFKNAGTTIDWSLRRNFRREFVDHRDDDSMRKGAVYLGQYLKRNKSIRALSTHHLTLPLPDVGIKFERIVVFRHPIERVTSVYNFERNQVSDTHPGVIHARKLSLRDYIVWRMRPEVGATIRNYHARKLLPPRKIGQEVFGNEEMAELKHQLSKIEMLGLVERFDESMVLFEEQLHSAFPTIDLSYIRQNSGQNRRENIDLRIEALRTNIGNDVFDLLVDNNREDIQLYEWAKGQIECRIAKVPEFEKKLAQIQIRCADLVNVPEGRKK
jgi:hypothetical protein